MRRFLVLLLLLMSVLAKSQNRPYGARSIEFTIKSDTIQVDSISINPVFFEIYDLQKRKVDYNQYSVDFAAAKLWFSNPDRWINRKIEVVYLPFPEFMTRSYSLFNSALIVDEATDESQLYSAKTHAGLKKEKPFDGLYTSGSLSRGVTIGSNQDAVVNSNFNLQIEGQLSDKVGIRASITDNEVPLQAGGFTQRLDEFDRVFIELYAKNWSLTAGDIDLNNPDSYLMRFQKKISGVLARGQVGGEAGRTDFFASGALVRGKYQQYKFNGIDGNQGPYKIFGEENQSFIIMISGSERVYANGVLLRRGDNFDYTIDYNTGEITFTALYAVNSNLRFTVEYQLSERNYNRFLTFDGVGFETENLEVDISYYNESDIKNSPVDQDLTSEQKKILAEAGNDKSKMQAPSAVEVPFSENRILYKKTQLSDIEIFEFSTEPNESLYQVSFTYSGENNGDYIIESTLASGRVYSYVPEANGIKQGNYQPVVQLVAPEKLQMINARANYSPGEKTSIKTELALSDQDQNLYSAIDNEDNKGLAAKLNLTQKIFDRKWELFGNLDYEYFSENFRSVERIRNVEFARDWDIVIDLNEPNRQQQYIKGGFQLANDSVGSLTYQFEHLGLGSDYNGDRHSLLANMSLGKTNIYLNSSTLKNESSEENSSFDRIYSGMFRKFSKFWIGARYNYEKNVRFREGRSGPDPLSHSFTEIEGYTGIGDSTKVFLEIGYNFRKTDSVQDNRLGLVSKSHAYFLKSKLLQNVNSDLSVFINYRTIKNINITDESSLNARLSYRQRILGDFIGFQTLYETKSGNLPQQEFSYVEVDPGKGFYEWIDFNGNDIQEIDEFVVAKFQDEARYVRVLLPSISYLKTNQNKWSLSLNLNGASWGNKTGVKQLLSHFANQTYFVIDVKTRRGEDEFNLQPFVSDSEDLLGLDQNFKNSLFFNRGLQRFSMVYSYLNFRKKTIYSFGDQEVSSGTHQFQFVHKSGKFWLFDITGGLGNNYSSSNSYSNRNYELDIAQVNPKISYLYNQNTRFEMSYTWKNKENRIRGLEKLMMHVLGSNFQYAKNQRFSLNASANLYFNEFEGDTNSPVAYQMLEGLQPGTNVTWLLGLQKRLTSFLDVNLNYFGRASEVSRTIHSGNIQLRATF